MNKLLAGQQEHVITFRWNPSSKPSTMKAVARAACSVMCSSHSRKTTFACFSSKVTARAVHGCICSYRMTAALQVRLLDLATAMTRVTNDNGGRQCTTSVQRVQHRRTHLLAVFRQVCVSPSNIDNPCDHVCEVHGCMLPIVDVAVMKGPIVIEHVPDGGNIGGHQGPHQQIPALATQPHSHQFLLCKSSIVLLLAAALCM